MRSLFCVPSVVSARTRVCFRLDCFTMATLSGAGGVEGKENLEKSTEAKAKVEDEKKKREEEIEKILMEKIGPPPEKPLPGDCCGSGCETCVWDTYFDQLQEYKKEKDSILKSISLP